jgi:hypothetical protein
VSLELPRTTLDEALAALEKGAGLRISPAGPLRRVSTARGTARPSTLPTPGGSPTASFTLKRAAIRDILAVMTDVDPALAALGPEGSLGRASLWARDVALQDLRAGVLESAVLVERIEEGRRILERLPNSDVPVFPVAGALPSPRLALRPQDLAVLEFELAGLATAGEGWLAFAYSPTGALNAYRVGDALADGSVRGIESTDVVLETEDGPLRIPIVPLK